MAKLTYAIAADPVRIQSFSTTWPWVFTGGNEPSRSARQKDPLSAPANRDARNNIAAKRKASALAQLSGKWEGRR